MARRLTARDFQRFDQQLHFPNSRLTRFGISNIPGCIGVRLEKGKKQITPGPADYTPDYRNIIKTEPDFSMAKRLEHKKRFKTPAPNEYNLPRMLGPSLATAKSAPNFTMRPRNKDLASNTKSPGPAYYSPDAHPTHSRQPEWQFGRKVGHTENCLGPGPAKYLPSLYVKPAPAAYTMGIRHSKYQYDAHEGKPASCGVIETFC